MGVLRGLLLVIRALLFLLFFSAKILFRLFQRIFKGITNKLRFSITFKITMTYVLVFIFVFSFMNVGIIMSFEHYLQDNQPQNYVALLAVILGVFNIIGIMAIILIGSKVSRKLLSPVLLMTETVREISINKLDKRLDVSGSKDELKDLAQTFNDMLDRIGKSVEQQNRFVSDASHELRTPIAVIQGYASLLARWGKDDRQVLEEAISAIQSEADSMKHLVEKLLFLAREDNKTLKIEKQEFLLNEVVNEILRETGLIDKNHTIASAKNEEIRLWADQKLIKEAIRIIMDNSIKYTPPGGKITLNSYRKKDKAVISIEDTGKGIAKEDLPHIFDRFYRADKSRTKESGGTGLGLAIAKLIIDNHQGRIDVWSELGAGTIVRIEIPLNLE